MIILPATAPRKPKLLFPDRSLMLPNLRHTLQIRNQQKRQKRHAHRRRKNRNLRQAQRLQDEIRIFEIAKKPCGKHDAQGKDAFSAFWFARALKRSSEKERRKNLDRRRQQPPEAPTPRRTARSSPAVAHCAHADGSPSEPRRSAPQAETQRERENPSAACQCFLVCFGFNGRLLP